MLAIYANSINYQEIDGLILPLYEKYGQDYNVFTFEILLEMYYKINDLNTAMRVWNQMKIQISENLVKSL